VRAFRREPRFGALEAAEDRLRHTLGIAAAREVAPPGPGLGHAVTDGGERLVDDPTRCRAAPDPHTQLRLLTSNREGPDPTERVVETARRANGARLESKVGADRVAAVGAPLRHPRLRAPDDPVELTGEAVGSDVPPRLDASAGRADVGIVVRARPQVQPPRVRHR